MKLLSLVALSLASAAPALAEETRQLHAHEHGVGQLDIAFEGQNIAMELHVPGADIVGFEYEAVSSDDLGKITSATALLSKPLELFSFPSAAGCRVTEASAGLEAEHEDHDHDADHDHGDDDESHDDHHDHDAHGEGADHTEFHAEYLLTCTDITAATEVNFTYFDTFPNALKVDVQAISTTGATAFEVERAAPILDLTSLF